MPRIFCTCLRTFPLVALASCGYMLAGIQVLDETGAEAQAMMAVITGMGFIGERMVQRRSPEVTVRAAWLLFAALLPAVMSAADFRSLRMERDGNRYTVYAETFLLASPDFVYSVLLDYDQFHRLSEGISESRWLDETHANLPLAYTRIDSCVALFCRKLEKVEIVTASGASEILTEALPERSDFRYNRTRWRLAAEDGGTRIAYELEMEPDFWVPPLIGPWAIRHKAESSAMKIARRIEYLARQGIPLDQFDLKRYLATAE